MVKVKKYLGTETYMFQTGKLATPEKIKNDYPAVDYYTHIVETDDAGEVMFAFQNLSAVRSQMGIDGSLTETQAIAEIERLRNLPPEEPMASAEEITAAQSWYENTLNA